MGEKKKKSKFDFKKKKDNAIKSLGEVEKFLKDFTKAGKYTKLYSLLKKK